MIGNRIAVGSNTVLRSPYPLLQFCCISLLSPRSISEKKGKQQLEVEGICTSKVFTLSIPLIKQKTSRSVQQ